jgi:phosphoglycolate phosphatase-like HAD superfamily hydrolase
MIKEIHIFDLDGTLVDSSHRYATVWNGEKVTIDIDHWRANEDKFWLDLLLPTTATYKMLNNHPDVYTIWITARTEKHMNESEDWLIEKLGAPNKMFCRPNGNNESGATLKAKQLKSFFNLRQFANVEKTFYEDNKSYLDTVCAAIDAKPVYIESKQGH